MSEMGSVVWFTGLAASGKSTLASVVEMMLRERGLEVENLDADEVRRNLSPNLGFSAEARDENTKRLAWMGQVLSRHGVHVVIAAVAPLQAYRDRAREWCPHFVEVFVKAPLEVCQERDPKGLYARAARGEINDIAGMHMPYEEPVNPELVVDTTAVEIEEGAKMVIAKLEELGYL
jgi:adenylylsulfate kinase